MVADRPQARRLIPHSRRCVWAWLLLVFLLVPGLPPSAGAAKIRPKVQSKPQGVIHVVEVGQTLFRISLAYQVKVERLMEANRLRASSDLRAGQRLFIPGAKGVKPVESSRPLTPAEREALERSLSGETRTTAPSPAPPRPRVRTDADFVWPSLGPINSPFGPRRGRFHAGIDIGSPHYQEVVAAADGEVIYANETKGALGKAIVLQHGHGFRTVYAHLSIIIAGEGDTVRQGQAIGGVGDTGRATGPHLHFEIRRNGAALNPEDYLPATIDELVQDLSRKR